MFSAKSECLRMPESAQQLAFDAVPLPPETPASASKRMTATRKRHLKPVLYNYSIQHPCLQHSEDQSSRDMI